MEAEGSAEGDFMVEDLAEGDSEAEGSAVDSVEAGLVEAVAAQVVSVDWGEAALAAAV